MVRPEVDWRNRLGVSLKRLWNCVTFDPGARLTRSGGEQMAALRSELDPWPPTAIAP